MNKISILSAVLAVSSGALFASGPDSKILEERVPSQKSEVFERMSKDDSDETQNFKMDVEVQEISSDSENKMEQVSEEEYHRPSKEMRTPDGNLDEKQMSHDAERAASILRPRYAPLIQFAHRVRTALPHLLFSAAMTGFTVNELNDRDGPDTSIIPLSSMALLGGFHAVRVLCYGQNSAYTMVPNTVREAVETGVSLIPGLAYSTYHHLTQQQSSTISENTKQCVRKCLE